MIDANSICLDLEHIYTDVSTCETVLICLPIFNLEKPPVDLKNFFKNIVFSTQFDQTENCDYIAKLINYLNSASAFSLEGFKEILDAIDKGAAPQLMPQSAPVQPVAPHPAPQPMSQQRPVHPAPQPMPQQKPVQPAPQPMPQQKPPMQGGFAIPGQPTPTGSGQPVLQGQPAPQVATPNGEKEMSWLYLMQHYNKENAAIYKAQQDAKKAAKANGAPAGNGQPPMQGRPPMPGQPPKPGQPPMPNQAPRPTGGPTPGFAIPGQPTPAPAPIPQQRPVQPAPAPTPRMTPTEMALHTQPAPQQGAHPAPYSAPQSVPQQAPVQPAPTPAPSVTPMNFGETTVLSGGNIGETTVLGASPMVTEVKPYLVRLKNNEKILLDKPVFRIGKEKSYVDYFIGDNTAISRSHANIISRDGEYFVVDTNSTNHTYLNGAMLSSNVEAKISHGAKIKLANEEFEFKIY